jgi:hypothetical protein
LNGSASAPSSNPARCATRCSSRRPILDAAFDAWIVDPESERGQRVERALVKYVARAAGRATPFGLFAGKSVGRIGDVTDLVLDASARSLRHSRLGHGLLFALVGALTRDQSGARGSVEAELEPL